MIQARYVFTLLACLGNMLNLLGRDSLRIAILAIREEASQCKTNCSNIEWSCECCSCAWCLQLWYGSYNALWRPSGRHDWRKIPSSSCDSYLQFMYTACSNSC